LDWSDIVSGLTSETHQLRLVAVPGPGDSLLLDDTYNASPASSIAALNLLAELDGRRVAVLGDMLELGSATEAGHRQVGRRAAEVVDLLITVGQLAEIMANEALAFGLSPDQVVVLPDVQRAVDRLPTLIRPHDMVLIKGSRGIRLDRLVDCLSYGRTNAED
jgi:UDP-N-acetylmuramoyl-tripeptide--D-alanyl-D-alanine ligase